MGKNHASQYANFGSLQSFLVAVLTMKNTFKRILQVILRMSLSLQLSIRENMNAEFSVVSSLPMFIQFLSSNFTGFILCSWRLFCISAVPFLRIFFRDFNWFIVQFTAFFINSFAMSLYPAPS